MARNCSICAHPKRLQIEQAMIAGVSLRDVAGRFGTAKTIVARHRDHVAESIAQSKEARDLVRTSALLDDVRAGERRAEQLYEQAEEILTSAIQNNDGRTALHAIRTAINVMGEARGYLELRGELTNELGRDRTPASMAIQIVCPAMPSGDQIPRITFAQQAATDGPAEEEGILEIGLIQPGG